MSNNKILGSKRNRDNEENSNNKKILYQNSYRGKLGRDIFFCGIWRVKLKKSEIENNFTFIESKKEYQTKIPINLSLRTNNNKSIIYSIQIDDEEKFREDCSNEKINEFSNEQSSSNEDEPIIIEDNLNLNHNKNNSINNNNKEDVNNKPKTSSKTFNIKLCIHILEFEFQESFNINKNSRKDITIPLKENILYSISEFKEPEINFFLEIDVRYNKSTSIYNEQYYSPYVGLQNPGTTCYMNSLIQILYSISYFRKGIFDHINKDSPNESKIKQFQFLFYEMMKRENKNNHIESAISTSDLMQSFGWSYQDALIQNDIHEFFMKLSDSLEKNLGQKFYKFLFEGKTVSVIKCNNVDYKSEKEDKFSDIQLPIIKSKNLIESFEKFTESEELVKENQYQTEKFGLQDAVKKTFFVEFPKILMIQLSRFEYNPQTNRYEKNNSYISYEQNLDLKKFLKENDNNNFCSEYTLHSVVVHSGDLNYGHYFCYIKIKDKWIQFNDEKVRYSNLSEVFYENFGGSSKIFRYQDRKIFSNKLKNQNNAYMLVYIRKDVYHDLIFDYKIENIPQEKLNKFKESDLFKQRNKILNHINANFVNAYVIFYKDVNNIGIIKNYSDKIDFNKEKKIFNFRVCIYIKIYELINILSHYLNVDSEKIFLYKFSMNSKYVYPNRFNYTLSYIKKNKYDNQLCEIWNELTSGYSAGNFKLKKNIFMFFHIDLNNKENLNEYDIFNYLIENHNNNHCIDNYDEDVITHNEILKNKINNLIEYRFPFKKTKDENDIDYINRTLLLNQKKNYYLLKKDTNEENNILFKNDNLMDIDTDNAKEKENIIHIEDGNTNIKYTLLFIKLPCVIKNNNNNNNNNENSYIFSTKLLKILKINSENFLSDLLIKDKLKKYYLKFIDKTYLNKKNINEQNLNISYYCEYNSFSLKKIEEDIKNFNCVYSIRINEKAGQYTNDGIIIVILDDIIKEEFCSKINQIYLKIKENVNFSIQFCNNNNNHFKKCFINISKKIPDLNIKETYNKNLQNFVSEELNNNINFNLNKIINNIPDVYENINENIIIEFKNNNNNVPTIKNFKFNIELFEFLNAFEKKDIFNIFQNFNLIRLYEPKKEFFTLNFNLNHIFSIDTISNEFTINVKANYFIINDEYSNPIIRIFFVDQKNIKFYDKFSKIIKYFKKYFNYDKYNYGVIINNNINSFFSYEIFSLISKEDDNSETLIEKIYNISNFEFIIVPIGKNFLINKTDLCKIFISCVIELNNKKNSVLPYVDFVEKDMNFKELKQRVIEHYKKNKYIIKNIGEDFYNNPFFEIQFFIFSVNDNDIVPNEDISSFNKDNIKIIEIFGKKTKNLLFKIVEKRNNIIQEMKIEDKLNIN